MNQPVLDRLHTPGAVPKPDREPHQPLAELPPPKDVESTGLPFPFLVELMLKVIFEGGQLRFWDCKERIHLPLGVVEAVIGFMRAERLCEIQSAGAAGNDMHFALTDLGRARALDALAKNQYTGPCP